MTVYLGVDLGAGSMKVTVVGADARVLGQASSAVSTMSPHTGWAEQDPAEWRLAMLETIPAALVDAGVAGGDVGAVSFSAGAHSFVLEDESGKVVRPAIMWMDQRSGDEVARLKADHSSEIYKIAGNAPSPTWTLPQLFWLARIEPDTVSRAARLYVAKDWLRTQLSGDWSTDHADAIGTMLWDVAANSWSERLCGLIDWNAATLPPVVEATEITGETRTGLCEDFGLPPGIPVVCGTSDTAVETLAGGGLSVGDATVKLATAGTVSILSPEPVSKPTLINYPYVIPGMWYTISGTNSCASAHRWYSDLLYGGSDRAALTRMDEEVSKTQAGAQGLLFHPYLNGERAPYWEPRLKADFLGMTFAHGRGHMSRAVYEGIAFSLKDVMGDFKSNGLSFERARIIGGGAQSAVWRQIVADVLDVTIVRAVEPDASFGAALLAGVAVGGFASLADAIAMRAGDKEEHAPQKANRQIYDDLFGIYRDAQVALRDIDLALHDIQGRAR